MTSHITNRVTNVARTMTRNAQTLEHHAPLMDCPKARGVMLAEALAWRQCARTLLGDINLGDIGEGAEEWESEPLVTPVEVPAEPEKVPA